MPDPRVELVDPQAVTTEEQPQADPNQIQQAVVTVQDALMTIREALEKAPGILPEDKQRLDGIISEYRGFITENLSAAPGQSGGEAPVQDGQAPVEAGARQVQQLPS